MLAVSYLITMQGQLKIISCATLIYCNLRKVPKKTKFCIWQVSFIYYLSSFLVFLPIQFLKSIQF